MIYLGTCQTSMMEPFQRKVNSPFVDVCQDPKYVSLDITSGAYRENSKRGSKFGVKGHFLLIRLFSSVYSLNQKANWNWKEKQQNVFSKADISTKN